ncbi:MAG TPA: HAD-IA family hydrolase [Dongiaceae bacterium]
MALRDRKLLTFDVMGTLIDFESGVLGYIRPIAQKAGVDASDDTILASLARTEARLHEQKPEDPFPAMLAPMYRAAAAELGFPGDAKSAEGLRGSIPDWPAFPDSAATLKQLKKRFRLVAMTNADNWAVAHFSRTLDEPFDDMVTAEDVGVCKPDPQVFAYTRGRQSAHGYKLADFLHVAQSQFHDIGVAKRLGFNVCWIERRMGKKGSGGTPATAHAKPDYHFGNLAELAAAVEAGK